MNSFNAILKTIEMAHLSVTPMESNIAVAVADAPSKCILKNTDGSPYGVLFISSSANPEMLKRSADSSETIRSRVGESLGSPILKPLYTGDFEGLSYVVWPWQNPITENRLMRKFKKTTIVPSIVSWLMEVTEKTKGAVRPQDHNDLYAQPLGFMAGLLPELNVHDNLPYLCTEFSQNTDWEPSTVSMHGDFWLDNILLSSGGAHDSSYGFTVIDWAGSMLEGHPVYDLLRFSESVGSKPIRVRQWCEGYKKIIGCSGRELYAYLFASLGYLGTHLEDFPEERYHQLVYRMIDEINKAGFET